MGLKLKGSRELVDRILGVDGSVEEEEEEFARSVGRSG
jgi:hypothetical protein